MIQFKSANTINNLLKQAHCEGIIEYLYNYILENGPTPKEEYFDDYDKARAILLSLRKHLHNEIELEDWEVRFKLEHLHNLRFKGIAWKGYLQDLEDTLKSHDDPKKELNNYTDNANIY